MIDFETQLKDDLTLITANINKEKDPIKRALLIQDLYSVKLYLNYPIEIKKNYDCYKDKMRLLDLNLENNIFKFKSKKGTLNFITERPSKKQIKNILNDFLYSKTDLGNYYDYIETYSGILTFKKSRDYEGKTKVLKSINKAYVEVHDVRDKIETGKTLIHELGHVKFCLDSNEQFDNSLFSEIYSIYLENKFIKYLYDLGYKELANNHISRELEILSKFVIHTNFLLNDDSYQSDIEKAYKILSLFSRYRAILGMVGAFYFESIEDNDLINILNFDDSEIINIIGKDTIYNFKQKIIEPKIKVMKKI